MILTCEIYKLYVFSFTAAGSNVSQKVLTKTKHLNFMRYDPNFARREPRKIVCFN